MILTRYLVKEIASSFSATLLILTLIIIGNTFVRLLSQASAGELPVDLLGNMLLYGSLKNLVRLMPIALLIGMMLAFSRLYRDSEMAALNSAGFSPLSFYKAIAWFVIPLTLLLGFLAFQASPLIESKIIDTRREMQQRPEAAGIPAGQFVTSGSVDKNYTLLAENISPDNTTMERFFVRLLDDDTETIIWARSAILFIDSINNERFLQIQNGYRYETSFDIENSDAGASVVRFSEHGIRIPLRSFAADNSIEAIPTLELLALPSPANLAELHWRVAIVLSAPLLALLAFPLSYTAPRQGRFAKVTIGIFIYGVYASLLMSAKDMLEQERLPAIIGMWWIHLLLLILIIWLLRRYHGRPR